MTTINQLINLRGRRALITGATGGLGRVMADTLAQLGAELFLVDRPDSNIATLADELKKRWDVIAVGFHCDLEQQGHRLQLIEDIKARNEGLNILINNAAFVGTSDLQGWSVPFEQQHIDTWRRAIEVNLTAVFELCQAFSPQLRAAEGGNIINVASIYGEYGPDWRLYEGTTMANPAAYGASKGGVIQLTRWLATTLAPYIRVNSISPGGIIRGQPQEFVTRYELRTPLGRMATENDFRGVVAFLASDMSGYVTGQNLAVDGGWGAW